jgi:pyruvate formate lyase activating enzyme
MIAVENNRKDFLTATTLLVPGYIDAQEVESIAQFIAALNPDVPYSLLAFHPDYAMQDMPVTTEVLAEECRDAAGKHLNRVNLGNRHLLA